MKKLHWTDFEFDRTYFLFTIIIIVIIMLYFFPLYLVVVYYANSVFAFFFFYSRAAVSVVFSTLLSCSGFIVCSFCIMYFYLNK